MSRDPRKVTLWMGFVAVATALTLYAGGPPPKVSSADPPSAEQGSVGVDVRILGNNFAPGSTVRFLVAGTDDEDEIAVNSVAFVDVDELEVNIDVEETALVGDYDIEVLSNGRRGKGREKFAVTEKGGGGPSAITITGNLRNQAGDSLISANPATPIHDGTVPETGNLVFDVDGPGDPFVLLLGDLSGNLVTVESPCPGDPNQVCFSNGDPLLPSYDIPFLSINRLTEQAPFDPQYCDGTPTQLDPRDMVTGECIKVYAASGQGRGTDPTSKHRAVKLRCGKHPNEGTPLEATCTAHDAEGCLAWTVAPCHDDGSGLDCTTAATGSESLVCQWYEVPLKGNKSKIELGEYEILFGITVARDQ